MSAAMALFAERGFDDGRNVLAVGCGGGRLTTFAASRAASVYAFDPDAGNIEKAAAAGPADVRDRVRFAVHLRRHSTSSDRASTSPCAAGRSDAFRSRDVVNALRRIHAARLPGGLVVNSQPISPEPAVKAAGRQPSIFSGLLEVEHEARRA
jgi:cyclopropane fatty-acyl-phospholipid synthase-like methyltransferase